MVCVGRVVFDGRVYWHFAGYVFDDNGERVDLCYSVFSAGVALHWKDLMSI